VVISLWAGRVPRHYATSYMSLQLINSMGVGCHVIHITAAYQLYWGLSCHVIMPRHTRHYSLSTHHTGQTSRSKLPPATHSACSTIVDSADAIINHRTHNHTYSYRRTRWLGEPRSTFQAGCSVRQVPAHVAQTQHRFIVELPGSIANTQEGRHHNKDSKREKAKKR
jgi:hypothetical protein